MHVEEDQRRGFEEEVKAGRIQQGMEGHQHGPRRMLIDLLSAPLMILLRRFLKKNLLLQDVGAGLITMSYLGNAGWRSNRSSTACIATLPSAMPFW